MKKQIKQELDYRERRIHGLKADFRLLASVLASLEPFMQETTKVANWLETLEREQLGLTDQLNALNQQREALLK